MSVDAPLLTGVGQFADIYLALKGKGLSHEQALDLIERVLRVHYALGASVIAKRADTP
jgi:hypothetical protein